jgi:hypothetical protein
LRQNHFRCRKNVLDKSKARFGRLQNSPSAQTFVIAHPALRQDCMAKTLLTAAQIDILTQNMLEGEVTYEDNFHLYWLSFYANRYCFTIFTTAHSCKT